MYSDEIVSYYGEATTLTRKSELEELLEKKKIIVDDLELPGLEQDFSKLSEITRSKLGALLQVFDTIEELKSKIDLLISDPSVTAKFF